MENTQSLAIDSLPLGPSDGIQGRPAPDDLNGDCIAWACISQDSVSRRHNRVVGKASPPLPYIPVTFPLSTLLSGIA